MAFDFDVLEPQIQRILSAPGTDLTTISAKRVRRQLLDLDPSLTAEFLKENRESVDAVIGRVFEKVSAQGVGGSQVAEETKVPDGPESRKRKQESEETEDVVEDVDDEEEEPRPKKAKKAGKKELSDAELARKLSSEINSRSRRTATSKARTPNGAAKKGSRAKKSAAMVDSDDDSDGDDGEKKRSKPKRKSASTGGGGAAKGGFAKEYALSEPLAALLKVDKLSRPQVVKQLWVYIKGNELQNPENKREIMCDGGFRAVFGVDKIDMFKMNKVLGQHLHENEG